MTLQEQLRELNLCDNAVLRHGFVDYNRDYQLTVESVVGPMPPGLYSYLFRGCVEAIYESNVPAAGFSVNDVYIDHQAWEAAGCPAGFVWGVKWADAYPGWYEVNDSPRAARHASELGIDMHEIVVETDTYTLNLVFHDLVVTVRSDALEERPGRIENG